MSSKKFNFYAGPAVLPQEVFKEAEKNIVNFNNCGLSILEISHRSKDFDSVINDAEAKLRKNMSIPDNDSVLFLQGGASTQFAMIPMNIAVEGKPINLINTGTWTKKAVKEAKLFSDLNIIGTSEDKNFSYLPKDYKLDDNASYLHIASNNTIFGTQWKTFPETGNIPLVADMSSDILSRKIDVSKFGIIFAGAQKNMGPAGVTIVIIRNDLLDRIGDKVPTMLSYKTHVDKKSMFNTPPTFSIYIVLLVMKWIENCGGIEAIEKNNNTKAKILYDAIDNSDGYYKGTVEKEFRSTMNVPFRLPSEELEAKFISEATEAGLIGLKGHRSVGGCRASIY
ncbi:MAG: 3-phosphoserine/phosphohydroxythreonine transaminase, partial [Actinomycetia bacterium]|nr:3-phosphoserine/phosphohydroxythreonine transaminase [Actinomycetes bacterium]